MSALDLLGDPLPDYTPELPVKEQFSYFDDLVGHTIKAVFCPPTGKRDADVVIVTETGCWIAAEARTDGCGEDSASLNVLCGYWGGGGMLSDYCSADELLRAAVISSAEHGELKKAEEAAAAKRKEERAARLRSELAKLEGGAS